MACQARRRMLCIVYLVTAGKTTAFLSTATVSNAVQVSDTRQHFNENISRHVEIANAQTYGPVTHPDNYPTIDISPFLNPESHSKEERDQVVRQVLHEATTNGSFNIVGHGVSTELISDVDAWARDFFSLPIDVKRQYSRGNNKAGFVALREESSAKVYGTSENNAEMDLREIYSVMYPPEMNENVAAPAPFQEVLSDFVYRLEDVDFILHNIFTEALKLAKNVAIPVDYLNKAKGTSTGLFRCSHYPVMPAQFDDATKLHTHSDWGTLTIIYSEAPGLEEVRDGKWIQVPIRKGELHVAVGETMSIWSNELFVNNIHRVSNQAAGYDRISFAHFGTGGLPDVGPGIVPVVAEGEEPKFAQTSGTKHMKRNIEILMQPTVVASS